MASERLLEREGALAAGHRAVLRARAGSSGALCLLGPAGVGKTSLLRALLAQAPDGLRTLHAVAGALESRAPYGVVRQWFGQALARLPAERTDLLRLGAARPAVDLVLHREGPAVDRAGMLNSLYWLLDALAAEGPVVLAVDDAQWADEASLLFCRHVLDRLDALPVLVVVAARDVLPDRRTPAFAALVAHPDATTIALDPLSPDAVRACLAARWSEGVSGAVATAAAELTGGNPFLVVALADLLAGQPPDVGPDTLRRLVPRSVVDAVVHRLASLPPATQALARAVAVLDTASSATAAAVAGTGHAETAVSADTLRDAGLLAEEPPLAYRHALLRTAVYAATGAAERAELHRRAARVLAEDADAVHAAASHLLEVEGRADPRSVRTLAAAAAAALTAGEPQVAVALLRRAVVEPPPAAELPAVLVQLGLAELHAGDPHGVQTLERAGVGVTDPALRAQCALALATAYSVGGFYDRSVPILAAALDGLGPEHGDLRLVVEAGLVSAALQVPQYVDEGRRRLAAHRHLAGHTPGERLLLIQQASVANAVSASSREVRDLALRAIGDGMTPEQLANPFEWTIARLQLAAGGEYRAVLDLCARGFDVAARDGSALMHLAASFVRGWAHLWAGRLSDADADFEATLVHADLVAGGTLVGVLAVAGRAEALLDLGRVAEAEAAVRTVDDAVVRDLLHAGSIHLLRARGLVHAALGDHEAALVELEECGRRLDLLRVDSPTWCAWRSAAVESAWALGRVDRARELARAELARAEQKGAPGVLGQALRLAGQVGVADGEGGLDLLRRSVAVLEGSDAALQEARSRVALGAALRRGGQRVEAREELRRGRERAHRLGALSVHDRAVEELRQASGRITRIEVTGAAALTTSERRVCDLAAAGLRNRDIAQRLFITTKTVETHLSRAYRKLGGGRDELAAALRDG